MLTSTSIHSVVLAGSAPRMTKTAAQADAGVPCAPLACACGRRSDYSERGVGPPRLRVPASSIALGRWRRHCARLPIIECFRRRVSPQPRAAAAAATVILQPAVDGPRVCDEHDRVGSVDAGGSGGRVCGCKASPSPAAHELQATVIATGMAKVGLSTWGANPRSAVNHNFIGGQPSAATRLCRGGGRTDVLALR